VTVLVPQLPRSLDPAVKAGETRSARMVEQLVLPSVFRADRALQPQLDDDSVVSAELVRLDPQTIVYTLNPKAVWSNGTPVDEADVVATWRERRSSPSNIGYVDIASISGPPMGNKATVVFAHRFADWESLFGTLLPVDAPIGWGDPSGGVPKGLPWLAGGPYQVVGFVPGQKIVLKPNPDWWGQPIAVGQIVLEADSNPGSIAQQATNGHAQVIEAVPSLALVQRLTSLPFLESEVVPSDVLEELVFNTRNPDLKSTLVRSALAHAVDRNAILAATVGLMRPSSKLPSSLFLPNGAALYRPIDVGFETADPSRARALLKEAAREASAIKAPSSTTSSVLSKPLSLDLNLDVKVGQLFSKTIATMLVSEMDAVGVKLQINYLSPAAFAAQVRPRGSFQLALLQAPVSVFPSKAIMAYVPSGDPNIPGNGSSWLWPNLTGMDDPDVNSLVPIAERDLDPNASVKVWNEITRQMWADMPAMPLFRVPELVAWNGAIQGIAYNAAASQVLWHAKRWLVTMPKPKPKLTNQRQP
jgi:peptide/nickel transport system substrate-binding protein